MSNADRLTAPVTHGDKMSSYGIALIIIIIVTITVKHYEKSKTFKKFRKYLNHLRPPTGKLLNNKLVKIYG